MSSDWTEPKQNKLARMKELDLRRGVFKKGKRHKGKKARVDELLSVKKTILDYRKHIEDMKVRHDLYGHQAYETHMAKWWAEIIAKYEKKFRKLIEAALRDGVVASTEGWDIVEL